VTETRSSRAGPARHFLAAFLHEGRSGRGRREKAVIPRAWVHSRASHRDRKSHRPTHAEVSRRGQAEDICGSARRRSESTRTRASGNTSPSRRRGLTRIARENAAGRPADRERRRREPLRRDAGDATRASVYVMIHGGAAYGWQTANHFLYEGREAPRVCRRPTRGLVASRRRALGKAYGRHNSRRTAVRNRHIHRRRRSRGPRKRSSAPTWSLYYEISQQPRSEETLVPADGRRRGLRPSAGGDACVPAASRPRGKRWESSGHP